MITLTHYKVIIKVLNINLDQGKNWESKISENKSHLNYRIIYLLYVFSLLKCSLFNPDPILRVKLIWSQQMKDNKNNKYYKKYLYIYGLNNATIDDLIKHRTTKNKNSNKEIYIIVSNNNANVLKEERSGHIFIRNGG